MKTALQTTIILLTVLLTVLVSGAQSTIPVIDQAAMPWYLRATPASTPTTTSSSAPPRVFTPQDSIDEINAAVDVDTKAQPWQSTFVKYTPSNDTSLESNSDDTAQAQAAVARANSGGSNLPTAGLSSMQDFLRQHLPQNDQRALNDYINLVSPKSYVSTSVIGHQSEGFRQYFAKKMGDQCFQNAALVFYNKVGEKLKGVPKRLTLLKDDLKSRVNGKLSPGWLWNLAMDVSNHDAGLAMHLIAMCGHDDREQTDFGNGQNYGFRDDSSTAQQAKDYEIDRFLQIRSDINAQVRRPTPQSKALIAAIDKQVAQIRNEHSFATITCPQRDSAFFAPQALGADIDIPEALKREIKKIQDPDDVIPLPAKIYHIYAGAMLTCKMIEDGMRPLFAREVDHYGASQYRGYYLCNVMNDALPEQTPGASSLQDFLSNPNLTRQCSTQAFTNQNPSLCKLARDVDDYRSRLSPQQLRDKIAGIQVTADATLLYNRVFNGGSPDHTRACTVPQFPGYRAYERARKPWDWSKDRYEAARDKLQTWIEDSNWTVGQHDVGAAFATKYCSPRPDDRPVEKAACSVVDSQSRGRDTRRGNRAK